jgi:hypothetical protein
VSELFDDVARTLATAPTRRRALCTIAGALASAALVNLWPRAAAAAGCPTGTAVCKGSQIAICCPGGKCCGPVCCAQPGQVCCSAGQCCSGSQCNKAGTCCAAGHAPCGTGPSSVCCAPNQQCLSGTCVARGSGAPGGGTTGQPPTSCPPGAKVCGGFGQCCPTTGQGQCCGVGASATCCWGGTCVNNVCVRGAPSGPPRTGA